MTKIHIFKRLYRDYTSKFLKNIILAVFFSIIVATSTSAIAWLLDPAIKKLFIEKDQTLIFIIPLAIIVAFAAKGISLYLAKTILIGVLMNFKIFYYFFLIVTSFHLFFIQLKKLKVIDPNDCLKKFKSNNYLGLIILVNILIGKII